MEKLKKLKCCHGRQLTFIKFELKLWLNDYDFE